MVAALDRATAGSNGAVPAIDHDVEIELTPLAPARSRLNRTPQRACATRACAPLVDIHRRFALELIQGRKDWL